MQRLPRHLPYAHLSRAERSEVLAGFGTEVGVELHHHPAHGDAADSHVEKTTGPLDTHPWSVIQWQ